MINFDNPFIVFIILFPGIFFNVLLVVLLQFLGLDATHLISSEIMILGFGSVFSLLVGIVLWSITENDNRLKNFFVKKYRLRFFESTRFQERLQNLTMSLPEIELKIREDFGREIQLENVKSGALVKEVFDNIFYGLHKNIKMARIVSIRLFIEFLPICIVALALLMIFTVIGSIIHFIFGGEIFQLSIYFCFLLVIYIACKVGLRYLDDQYFYNCLSVYTAKQYRDLDYST